jgi:hypothetical protein
MPDLFRFPFKRTVNFTGAYVAQASPAVRLVQEDMLFQAPVSGEVTGTLSGSINVTGSFAGAIGFSGNVSGSVSITGTFVAVQGVVGTFNSPVTIQASFTASSGPVGVALGVIPISSTFTGTHGEVGILSGTVSLTGTFGGQHFASVFGGLFSFIQPVGVFSGTFSGGVVANDNRPFIPIFSRRRSRR